MVRHIDNEMKMNLKNIILIIAASMSVPVAVSCSRNDGNKGRTTGMEYAELLSIEEGNGFKTVEIADPWNRGKLLQRYVLVQKGSEIFRDSLPAGTLVEVPIDNIIVYSSVHASILEELGAAERISGVCEPEYMTCKSVKEGIASGRITDCGNSVSPNTERIADAKGQAIIASPFENSNYGAAGKLGIPIIEATDYMENSPLARSEWIKLFGVLLCCEDKADSLFSEIKEAYDGLKDKIAKGIEEQNLDRPTLIAERKYGSSWGVPGGNSYIAHIYRDAGADYVFSGTEGESSVNMSFENVLTMGIDAEYWIFKYWNPTPMTYKALEAEYPLYSKFKAFKERLVYGCNTYESTYYDDIVLRPQDILMDLASIFHPELAGDYVPKYFLPLQ